MSTRPTLGCSVSNMVQRYLGTEYDKVKSVADNIDYIKDVAEAIEGLPVTSYIGDEPPVQPMHGAEWYCTTDGRSYVWSVDADSGQWVESSPQSAMKDEAINIFLHSTPSNVNPAYRNATLFSTFAPEAEISVAHNAFNTPVVQAQFIREEALWADVSVKSAQGIVTLMGYSSGNSQLKAEIISWKNGTEGTSLGASQWVTLPSQPSIVSLPVTLANIDVLDAGDSYVVKLTSQMNAGDSAVSTILVDGTTSSRFGIIFNTDLIGLVASATQAHKASEQHATSAAADAHRAEVAKSSSEQASSDAALSAGVASQKEELAAASAAAAGNSAALAGDEAAKAKVQADSAIATEQRIKQAAAGQLDSIATEGAKQIAQAKSHADKAALSEQASSESATRSESAAQRAEELVDQATGGALLKDQNLGDVPNKEAARTHLDVPSKSQLAQAISEAIGAVTPASIGARPDSWTPTSAQVGADPSGTATGAVSAHVAQEDPHLQYDYRWLNSTANTGVITGSTRCRWLVDTTTTRNRTIGADVRDVLVKDITGKASTNNITITAPSGKTINGAATETIDVNYGWVQYVLVGTDFKTIGGQ